MQQLQFTSTNGLPLNGLSAKKATHFVDKDDKFASSDAAAKSRWCVNLRYYVIHSSVKLSVNVSCGNTGYTFLVIEFLS